MDPTTWVAVGLLIVVLAISGGLVLIYQRIEWKKGPQLSEVKYIAVFVALFVIVGIVVAVAGSSAARIISR